MSRSRRRTGSRWGASTPKSAGESRARMALRTVACSKKVMALPARGQEREPFSADLLVACAQKVSKRCQGQWRSRRQLQEDTSKEKPHFSCRAQTIQRAPGELYGFILSHTRPVEKRTSKGTAPSTRRQCPKQPDPVV